MLAADLSRVVAMAAHGRRGVRGLAGGDRLRPGRLHGRRVEDVPPGAGGAAAVAGRVARGADRRERDVDRDRERRDVRSALRSAACCSPPRASAGSSSPTRSRSCGRRILVVAAPSAGPRRRATSRSTAASSRRPSPGFSALGTERDARVDRLPLLLPDGRRGRAARADRRHGARPARHRQRRASASSTPRWASAG